MPVSTKRRLVLDADFLVYTIGHKIMKPVDLGDGNVNSTFSMADLRASVDDLFSHFFEELNTRECVICLSDPEKNWRSEIYPPYKQNRKPGTRPMAYESVRRELAARWETLQFPRMEADDLVGALATDPASKYEENVIVSPDKDLLTIPGFLYNPSTKAFTLSTQEEADLEHMRQTLVGDRCDNFPGLPKCGPVGAAKILQGCTNLPEAWSKVTEAFVSKGLTTADATIQAQMAGILRHGQYNFLTQEILPWTPPQI